MHPETEKAGWDSTAKMLGEYRFSFGDHSSSNYRNDPKQIIFTLSRYKFAAKIACKKGAVLELGCRDGIGATILAETMDRYVGVDLDAKAIQDAKSNLNAPQYAEKYRFLCADFAGKNFGSFSAIVSLGMFAPASMEIYLKTILSNLAEEGICVIGTPNVPNHGLVPKLKEYFHQVFHFGMNDEMMTAYGSRAQYTLAVACHKKGRQHA